MAITIVVLASSAVLDAGVGNAATGGTPAALLANGVKGSIDWQVFVHRDKGRNGGHRPCFEAVSVRSGFALCGNLKQNHTFVAKSDGVGRRELTVLVLAYGSRVSMVKLWLKGRRPRWLKATPARHTITARARVRIFSYVATAFSGPFCLRRVIAADQSGHIVDRSDKFQCGG
jgi:hypothetical protein